MRVLQYIAVVIVCVSGCVMHAYSVTIDNETDKYVVEVTVWRAAWYDATFTIKPGHSVSNVGIGGWVVQGAQAEIVQEKTKQNGRIMYINSPRRGTTASVDNYNSTGYNHFRVYTDKGNNLKMEKVN